MYSKLYNKTCIPSATLIILSKSFRGIQKGNYFKLEIQLASSDQRGYISIIKLHNTLLPRLLYMEKFAIHYHVTRWFVFLHTWKKCQSPLFPTLPMNFPWAKCSMAFLGKQHCTVLDQLFVVDRCLDLFGFTSFLKYWVMQWLSFELQKPILFRGLVGFD